MKIPGFTLLRSEVCAQADIGPRRRPRFERKVEVWADPEGAEFVLVPGATSVRLGWNAGFAPLDGSSRASVLDDLERAVDPLAGFTKWRAGVDEASEPETAAWLDEQIDDARTSGPPVLSDEQRHLFSPEGYAQHVNSTMSPPRIVDIPTLLVERVAPVVGWAAMGEINPSTGESTLPPSEKDLLTGAARDLLTSDAACVQIVGLGRYTRLTRQGWWVAERQIPTTHADLVRRFAPFRLPSEDEWEHLADPVGGALFRWGNAIPDQWYGYGADPNPLDSPNGNGLVIGNNQFVSEAISDPSIAKGGDGGCTMHDGVGTFDMLLPLATAYRNPVEPDCDLSGGYFCARRVMELPPG